ncbi:type IV toxin-antitoxin system AbiEi family antitoxin domain-containing protein [Phycicoccus endophyticus]|uniref:Type IV toxin-antitoxin system AbiEi family antitoxin domain-containing protein n=1 Tax=Phycicoccus endophyticus TaxID=1690220 RepID=A0A7G9R4T0_9MICO|nr:type IV toxin-antitoxin system AbiEi family antitoxin domain-containing protein [Phycicoccus endophyticus]NHI18523.1 type IV toxin-antitoxin system AbiEi family antitoxin domain-containing protein [Phycicoccus endophyticus]QNN50605.1 type IV toxin-antitoxin system AbiEi family antitoxin domain-containing protein [Phycicoccus endophyticus]GGL23097.1 hypothetical protein GCM10012283_01500 [Phycicoccus endophyticus]
MPTLDAALLDTAAAQHGAFTTAQAAACGISAPGLVALVRAGVLAHPGRGVYLVSALLEPDAERRHLQLCAAALLVYPDAVLAGTSAVLAHGLPVWGVDLRRPLVRRPPDRWRGVACFTVRHGVGEVAPSAVGPAQPVARALVEHAVDHGIAPGVVSADAALHRGLVEADALATEVAAVATWRHGSRALATMHLADGRRESVGESRCGLALALAGIAVTPQVEIRDGRGRLVARVDWLVEGSNVIVEFDGRVKYGSGDPAVLWAEKRREDRLRRLGYVVVRITWADLERPGAVAAAVRSAVRAA